MQPKTQFQEELEQKNRRPILLLLSQLSLQETQSHAYYFTCFCFCFFFFYTHCKYLELVLCQQVNFSSMTTLFPAASNLFVLKIGSLCLLGPVFFPFYFIISFLSLGFMKLRFLIAYSGILFCFKTNYYYLQNSLCILLPHALCFSLHPAVHVELTTSSH